MQPWSTLAILWGMGAIANIRQPQPSLPALVGRPWRYEYAITTSCGVGGANAHDGPSKPRTLLDGVAAAARSAAPSRLPFLAMMFESDALEACQQHEGVRTVANASCVDARDVHLLSGYGYAKIAAVLHAPARHILWVDADAWFVGDPMSIFRSAGYKHTGSTFFPDFYRFFLTDETFWAKIRAEQRMPQGVHAAVTAPSRDMYPRGLWYSEAGFDSGLFAIDKIAAKAPLARLKDLAAAPQDAYWRDRSMGDKDLWKLAFMLSSHNVSLSPTPGIIGYWDPKALPYPRLSLVSLALVLKGEVVALHQNKDGGCADKRCVTATVDLRLTPWTWDPAHLDPMIHADYGVLLPLQTAPFALSLESPAAPVLAASIDAARREWKALGRLPTPTSNPNTHATIPSTWEVQLWTAVSWIPANTEPPGQPRHANKKQKQKTLA